MRNKLNLMYNEVNNKIWNKVVYTVKCEVWDKVNNEVRHKVVHKIMGEIFYKVSNEVWYIVRDGITKEMELFNEN